MSNFRWAIAERYKNLAPSALQGLLAAAADPEVISLAGGLPASDLLPVDILKEATDSVFKQNDARAFQYGNTEGVYELRQAIAEQFHPPGHQVSAENIIITSGSQQGLDLVSRLLCDPGDALLTESPTYVGAIQAFELNGVNLSTLPTDDHGVSVEALQSAATEPGVKGAYFIPNFQNPSGTQWSMERREQVAEVLGESSLFIIEDDPYGDLGFSDSNQTSIMAMAPTRTVYLGTLSKRLSPGVRIGWTVANPEIISKIADLKQGVDLHTSTFMQYVALEALKNPKLPGQMDAVRVVYAERCRAAIAVLENELTGFADWTIPQGGMFLWLTLHGEIDTEQLLPAVIAEEKIAYVPGVAFYPDGRGKNQLRINFSANPVSVLEDSLYRLCRFFKQHL